jgi:hypothetical protein
MEFPPFSATITGEKASQTDGFQSIRRINRYSLRFRDKRRRSALAPPASGVACSTFFNPAAVSDRAPPPNQWAEMALL